MSKRKTAPKLNREKLVAIIQREARRLKRTGDEHCTLDEILHMGLLWMSNSNRHTVDDYAAAVIALAPIADDRDLMIAAHTALWSRSGRDYSLDLRPVLEPLGVRYAPCGCLACFACDNCCDRAVASKEAA